MTLLKKLPSCISRAGAFDIGAGCASEAASMNGRGRASRCDARRSRRKAVRTARMERPLEPMSGFSCTRIRSLGLRRHHNATDKRRGQGCEETP
ncbi:hypothetical protein [Paenibacillus chitinolyticus]